jgi:D-alanyl-D-alanine carboxypeptidase/D-alanyl-D-alanine-endopeptidase (penicillin-binding protein 4)
MPATVFQPSGSKVQIFNAGLFSKTALLKTFALLGVLSFLVSCSTTWSTHRYYTKKIKKAVTESPVFTQGFTGFVLLDPETNAILCDVNGEKYFTPASNTKILTLFTCLHLLGDSLPGIQYKTIGDTIVFRGTGDPTFLHPDFKTWQSPWRWLKQSNKTLQLEHTTVYDFPLGPGWSWEDADEYYSPERSDLPAFGNVSRITFKSGNWQILPKRRTIDTISARYFHTYNDYRLPRLYADRHGLKQPAKFNPKEGYQQDIPIFNVSGLLPYILWDTLPNLDIKRSPVRRIGKRQNAQVLYSTPVDTVYRRMMYQSDNFIAEQLLMVCAGVKFDSLSSSKMIRWTQDSLFKNMPQPVKWVDGSGLSRYNLNTPLNNASLLRQLWQEQPRERLFNLFPAGGVSGTISDLYKIPGKKAWIYAKSGSMTGVQCLSGYLINRHGKVLIFSFMHNNFTAPGRLWKAEMQRILDLIRAK